MLIKTRSNFIATVVMIFVLSTVFCNSATATSKNLLPRMPEIVIEKGYSDTFEVTECQASAKIVNSDLSSNLKVTLKNVSEGLIKSSVKFRILYPTSANSVNIKINGKRISFDRKNPRYSFQLESQSEINFEISAKQSINYSINSVREALREREAESAKAKNSKKRFAFDELTRFFDNEKFGKRLMMGPLVSKWGIFPVTFKNVKIEVSVPKEFVIFSQFAKEWEESTNNANKDYVFNKIENFEAAVFLPESDYKDFEARQKILSSKEFLH
jgi:hypothetical protein